MRKEIMILLVVLTALLFVKCSTIKVPLYEFPSDLKDKVIKEKTIKDFSKYLSGKKIFLDPGHGGEDRRNKSLSSEIVEADVNLRVASYLKNFLANASAQVILSREKDETVQLAFRSILADSIGADIFISIHHNAPAKWEDDWTNYTSTYYHAKETDYEYEPCERDLARYIQRDLSYVMGNPGGLGSFDGTYSDYIIYPGDGFSVLRKTKIPAVLVECAFHTSRLEELRLNDDRFNEIQAWGIFRGIAKYFRSGIPGISFTSNNTKVNGGNYQLYFELIDSSGINPKSIQVFLNKDEIKFEFDKTKNLLIINLEKLENKENILRIVCANKNGNHSLPYHKKIKINDSQEIILNDQN